MSEHIATIAWRRGEQVFTDGKYSRAHQWSFDGGATVAASSSPSSVRVPWSDPGGVDPEEAFVAAISSCHMLWFLYLAAREQLVIESYVDDAIGVLGKTAAGKTGFTRVTLRPRITWGGGKVPDATLLDRLHHEAHELCFIANSTTAEIVVQARGLEG